jgi:hypothetical protein
MVIIVSMTGEQPQAGAIPEDYLDLMMKCPYPAGKAAGAMALGEFLKTGAGIQAVPDIIDRIEKADKIFATGEFSADEALELAFGGALMTDEDGAIVRQLSEPGIPAAQAETPKETPQEAKKKSEPQPAHRH